MAAGGAKGGANTAAADAQPAFTPDPKRGQKALLLCGTPKTDAAPPERGPPLGTTPQGPPDTSVDAKTSTRENLFDWRKRPGCGVYSAKGCTLAGPKTDSWRLLSCK